MRAAVATSVTRPRARIRVSVHTSGEGALVAGDGVMSLLRMRGCSVRALGEPGHGRSSAFDGSPGLNVIEQVRSETFRFGAGRRERRRGGWGLDGYVDLGQPAQQARQVAA